MENNLKDFIRDHASRVCENSYVSGQWYMHPDLNEFSKKAAAEGKKYFYADPAVPNAPHWKLIEAEPRYSYVVKAKLSEEEYLRIMEE